jgi:sigma-B regulation protein RsbU (phosphoserine phosphatase)
MTASLGVLRLQALLESAELLHASLELDDLLRHLLRTVMGRLVVGRALVAVDMDGVLRLALVRGVSTLKAGQPLDEAEARSAGIELFFSIGKADRPAGMLGVGRPPAGGLQVEEQEFLRALLGIAASGIANAKAHAEARRLNRRLDQKVQELNTLIEFTHEAASAFDPEEVARVLALTLAGQWAVSRFALGAWKRGHPPVLRQKGLSLPPFADIEAELAGLAGPVMVGDLPDGALKRQLAHQQAALVFPLRSGGLTVGLAVLGPRPGELAYGAAEREFGAGLVAQAVMALENAWLVSETLERQRIEKELALAASIQRGLFPSTMPSIDRLEVAARSRPARHVGGDYYDVLPVGVAAPGSPHLACVADVSGKGLASALLMSTMQATLRALLGRGASPGVLAASANELLHATTPGNKYVTAILLAVDPATGACVSANAGHNPGIVLRARGGVEWLPATGLALGLFPGAAYEEQRFSLEPGDLVACYSDGITEAQDRSEREFGVDQLVSSLEARSSLPCGEIVGGVFEDVDRFVAGAPQHDDVTLLILKRR